jgi:ATP-grasp domain
MSTTPAPIVLDTTLRDLYASEGGDEEIILVYAVPIAEVQMAAGIPLSKNFTYQSPVCPTNDSDTLARQFLQLLPQLFGFVAGKMPLVMFDLDHTAEEESLVLDSGSRPPHQADAHRVFDRLAPLQRPELTFVQKPSDIKFDPNSRFAIVNPMDCLLPLPHLVDPEAHYEVLSKRGLALSGLPTPDTEVIDTVLGPAQLSDHDLVDFEVQRMLARARARPLPFVLKTPQSSSGRGTFLVRNEPARAAALRILEPETRRMLCQITAHNAHLRPCSLILQSLAPGEAVALSLFITKSGCAIFNACCAQLVDAEGKWGGGCCDYREQDALRVRYAETADKLGAYMHKMGYWGPLGADIMTDPEGRQMVIDMNVRVTGSYSLGVLRGHFGRRELNVAVLFFPLMLRLTQDKFEAEFKDELHFGSLVVNAWVRMRNGKTSMTTVTLAAEDKDKLNEFVERVSVFKVQGH